MKKKLINSLLVLSMVTGLLVGCGEQKEETSASGEAKEEKVLYSTKNYDYWSMDPATFESSWAFDLANDVYESLVDFDSDMNIIPKLAESWEVSDDNLEYTFKLREGVQFHKGYGELKASDVVFTFDRMREMGDISTAGPVMGVDNFTVEAVDDYTVKFTFTEPDAAFLTNLAQWYGYIVSEKAVTELGDDFERNPIGTGPYVLTKCISEECEEGEAFDDYWGEKPDADKVVITYMTDGTEMLNAFDSGEVDFIISEDDQQNAKYVDKEGVWIKECLTPQIRIVGINPTVEPFNNPLVREAIMYAIDIDDYIDNFMLGMQEKTTAIVPECDKYAKTGVFNYTYNPEKAKELLAEAGYPNGFETTIGTPNDQSTNTAVVIQSYLKEVGITVNIDAPEFSAFMEKAGACEYPMFYFGRSSEVLPDNYFMNFMTDFIGVRNFCNYSDPKFDELANNAMNEANEEARAKAYEDAQDYLASQNIIYPLHTLTRRYICHDYVSGDLADASGRVQYSKVKIDK